MCDNFLIEKLNIQKHLIYYTLNTKDTGEHMYVPTRENIHIQQTQSIKIQ